MVFAQYCNSAETVMFTVSVTERRSRAVDSSPVSAAEVPIVGLFLRRIVVND